MTADDVIFLMVCLPTALVVLGMIVSIPFILYRSRR